MPYYQMRLGNTTRTYKAKAAQCVINHHKRLGMRVHDVVQVSKADYDSARAIDGCIVGDSMDLTKYMKLEQPS